MARIDFFRNLGLFAAPDFLDPQLCSQLRAQLSQTQSRASTIVGEQTDGVLNQSVRKAATVELEGSLRSEMRQRFLEVMPALQDYFQLHLTDCQGPEFLRYDAGAFYLAHRDASHTGPEQMQRRRISAVLFLNAQSSDPAPQTYGGGALMFYGLLNGPQWETAGFPLQGETGLLVAFRSDVLHEVLPITFGQRYTAVSWFT